MNYPDGTRIQIGDFIWVNEGTQVVKVADIIDGEEKAKEWGFGKDERGIFVCFDLSGECLSNDLFNSEKQFEDEGVGILNITEMELVEELLRKAIRSQNSSEQDQLCSLSTVYVPSGPNHFEHRWIARIHSLEGTLMKELMFSRELSELHEINRNGSE